MTKKRNEKELLIQSLKDLVMIYKPDKRKIPAFIRSFVKKYHVPGGYQKELEMIARKALENA